MRTFYGALVKHILQVLRERDGEQAEDKEWVLDEALNPKHLQFGGTFTNVLTRRIDEILTPILAEIIASIDFNYNLDLLRDHHVRDTPIHTLWISMFETYEYKEVGANPRDQVPGVGGHLSENVFKCQFPFSWIIKDRVEAERRYLQST